MLRRNLLYLLHFLSRQPRVMDSYEVSRKMRLPDGRRVSDRSVREWFKELQKGCFDYYPAIRFESLGLVPTVVLLDEPRDVRLWRGIPYCDFLSYNFDPARWKEVMLLRYLVPAEHLKDFRQLWERFHRKGLVSGCDVLSLSTPVSIYSPHHKVVARDGRLDFSSVNASDYDYFFGLLESRVWSHAPARIHPEIRKNPFIVPVLFEYVREHWSSRQVWQSIKAKLGDAVWDYIRRTRKRTDGVGISRVQKAVRTIATKHYDDFFQQVRVEYDPFYFGQNFLTFLIADFEDRESLVRFAKHLAQRSLVTYVHLNHNPRSNKTMFHFLTNHLELRKLLSGAVRQYTRSSRSNRILWKDEEKTKLVWRRELVKIDYARLFDPKECRWKGGFKKCLKKASTST